MNLNDKIPGTDVTVLDVICAFCDVMDGSDEYDIKSMTGMSDEACARVIEVRNVVFDIWLKN
jgi:hypothetical protein